MPDFQEIDILIKQQSSFNEPLKMTLIESAFLDQLKDSTKTAIITEEVFNENLVGNPDFNEVDPHTKHNLELEFYKNKYSHMFKNDQEKEKFLNLDDIKIIKQEVMMEILTNPESLNQYLEKIKNDYEKMSEANNNRRKDFINSQIFQLKILTNFLPKDSKMKVATVAYMNWLSAELESLGN